MSTQTGILALPNEILLGILNLFPSQELLLYASICRHLNSLIVRLLCHRLNDATNLAGHTLYLECHHPAANLRPEGLFCTLLGTNGLQELCDKTTGNSPCAEHLGQLQRLYTRFRPQRRDLDHELMQHRPGDIPGSRTYVAPGHSTTAEEPREVVRDTVTVDANDLWAQLVTKAYLGRRGPQGSIWPYTVIEGLLRVWRDWLSKHCESRTFSDHTTVNVQYHSTATSSGEAEGNAQSPSSKDPLKDDGLLWLNTGDNSLGLRLKVKSQRRRVGGAPLLYQNNLEMPVSYVVHFEEVLIRTWYLLLKIEEARQEMINGSGRAVVLGPYSESVA